MKTIQLLLMLLTTSSSFYMKSLHFLTYRSVSTLSTASSVFYCKDTIASTKANYSISDDSTKFTVYGEPLALARHRMTKRGFSYNPSSKNQASFLKAAVPFLPSIPFTGPLEVKLIFHFSRPKIHYRTGKFSHIMKEDVDIWHHKKSGMKCNNQI